MPDEKRSARSTPAGRPLRQSTAMTESDTSRPCPAGDWPRDRDCPWSRIADAISGRRCISRAGLQRAGVGRIRTMTPRVRAVRSAGWSAYEQRASRGTPRAWWVCVANRVEPGRRCSLELGVAREARRFTRWFAHGLRSCHRGKNDCHSYRSFRARRQSLFFAKPTPTSFGFAYRSPSCRSPFAVCRFATIECRSSTR